MAAETPDIAPEIVDIAEETVEEIVEETLEPINEEVESAETVEKRWYD